MSERNEDDAAAGLAGTLDPTQDRRVGRLEVRSLGKDTLNVVRFDGHEGLSELFEFTLEAISTDNDIDFSGAIGEPASLIIDGKGKMEGGGALDDDDDRRRREDDDDDDGAAGGGKVDALRTFTGTLVRTQWLGYDAGFYVYRLVLRPWLYLLSKTSDSRIFDNKTTPEILQEVFEKHSFSEYELKLTENYKPRVYCVQYRETDLEFVLRLMEEDGIYYFFEHKKDQCKMVLVDSISSHKPIPRVETLKYTPRMASGRTDRQSIFALEHGRLFQSGKVYLNDYDYMKPTKSLKSEKSKDPDHTQGSLELYDYPGRYVETEVGDRFANARLESEQAPDERRQAVGDALSLFPGGLFKLEEHPLDSENQQYLVVAATHAFAAQDYRSVAMADTGEAYRGTFELQPSDKPFRAPRAAKKPIVQGPQTAKVVGADGEEIDVDEEGRILVQFFWDRNKTNSRRVRVAQTWAGPQWGAIVTPRIGMEVVIVYLEGDPDQPLCVGCVYNGDNEPPYDLPQEKTVSGVKSNSSKGGNGYNEFVFDDKKGSELIRMHGQKDLDVTILNTDTYNLAEEFSGGGTSRTTTIHQGDEEYTIASGSQTVDINRNQDVTVGQNITIEAGQNITLEAGTKIELKVGSTKIVLTQTGIEIKAAATIEAKASGSMTLDGGASMTQKAGIIRIN